jgi:cyclopropane fatty-acyl-phospholipid synthase-like methyltransferase
MSWNITDARKLEEAIFEMKLNVARKIGVQGGMTVVDMGCGQGGFTAALAKNVGENGKLLAVDVSNEYVSEFIDRLKRYGVKENVTFIHKDALGLKDAIADDIADMVVSFRLLEELKDPVTMPEIVKEMVRVVKKGCKVCIVELKARTQNDAEETYVRLHRESGDSLFEPEEIVKAMKEAKLVDVRLEELKTNIWFSPGLAKQDLGFAQIWFDEDVKRTLGYKIDRYGMKYPSLHMFSGMKT